MKILLLVFIATCQIVASQECADRSSFCFFYKFLCGYSWHREWLKQNCKGTCPNFCPPKPKCDIPHARIDTGRKGSAPWQVVLMLNDRPMCSGALIATQWILTAAHCVDGLESFSFAFQVRLGEYNLGIREGSEVDLQVAKIITHPSYNRKTNDNDITVIKLQTPASLNTDVTPVCMPTSYPGITLGSRCYVTGWNNFHAAAGREPRLQNGRILIHRQTICGNSNATMNKITDHMICIKPTKSGGCEGDSGGPFVCQTRPNDPWRLMGVVSWGSRRCGDPDSFVVFAKVAKFKNWINEIIRG